MRVMVTGGAGYVGSHIVKALAEKGFDVLIFDNLSSGFTSNILYGDLIVGDLLDKNSLRTMFQTFQIDAVIHCAANIVIAESIQQPLKYYTNNVTGTLNLLQIMQEFGVNIFLFSSTAGVYDPLCTQPVQEDAKIGPISPYGHSKAIIEQILLDINRSSDFHYVSLRYFNVAGADITGNIGDRKESSSHLISMCLKTALGLHEKLHIFGADYSTKDGTCIRDYIHVNDLAQAHILALEYLVDQNPSTVFNCGYNKGYSVLEVIDIAKKITAKNFPVMFLERREGDLPIMIADSRKIKTVLGWSPQYNDLSMIIQSAWDWELSLRNHEKNK